MRRSSISVQCLAIASMYMYNNSSGCCWWCWLFLLVDFDAHIHRMHSLRLERLYMLLPMGQKLFEIHWYRHRGEKTALLRLRRMEQCVQCELTTAVDVKWLRSTKYGTCVHINDTPNYGSKLFAAHECASTHKPLTYRTHVQLLMRIRADCASALTMSPRVLSPEIVY